MLFREGLVSTVMGLYDYILKINGMVSVWWGPPSWKSWTIFLQVWNTVVSWVFLNTCKNQSPFTYHSSLLLLLPSLGDIFTTKVLSLKPHVIISRETWLTLSLGNLHIILINLKVFFKNKYTTSFNLWLCDIPTIRSQSALFLRKWETPVLTQWSYSFVISVVLLLLLNKCWNTIARKYILSLFLSKVNNFEDSLALFL